MYRGPGREPGASVYTLKRLSLSPLDFNCPPRSCIFGFYFILVLNSLILVCPRRVGPGGGRCCCARRACTPRCWRRWSRPCTPATAPPAPRRGLTPRPFAAYLCLRVLLCVLCCCWPVVSSQRCGVPLTVCFPVPTLRLDIWKVPKPPREYAKGRGARCRAGPSSWASPCACTW